MRSCGKDDLSEVPDWAGGMLVQTRLLMDTPAADDLEMKNLLEELELVLAQIVGLSKDNCAGDMAWIRTGPQRTSHHRPPADRFRGCRDMNNEEGIVMKTWNIVGFVFLVAALAVAGYALADEEAEFKMQEAREALNQARYEQAADLLEEVYELEREKQAAGNALYWQAFARYKMNRTSELKVAVELLQLQQEEYEDSETAAEGQTLLARLYGELAERGEVEGVREIHELSDDEAMREATRVAALEALMRMDPDKALPILEKIVTGEKKVSPEMQRHSVFILCRMDDERSEDPAHRHDEQDRRSRDAVRAGDVPFHEGERPRPGRHRRPVPAGG